MKPILDQPFVPTKSEAEQARVTLEQLRTDKSRSHYFVGSQSGNKAVVPDSVFKLVLGLLDEISKGHAVIVMPMQAELTTIDAADFLNVSRPHVIKLLEQGEIDYRLVGKHRRILFQDLLRYKEKSKRQRLRSIAEMTAEDDEMFGMGD